MSEKLKSRINSIFVQLNRYEKKRSDFKATTFIKDLDAYFSELDRADLSGEAGLKIDDVLKLRVNTISRKASRLVLSIANLMVLYFWYVRRPAPGCSNSLVAAKKLRGVVDDSRFIEETIAPLIFNDKIKGFGKYTYHLRAGLLQRAALVTAGFEESDQVNISATRIIKSDSWQKKMLHIVALHQAGKTSEISSIAPREELRLIASHNRIANKYLRDNSIYIGKNRFWLWVKSVVASVSSFIILVFNYRFVIHVFRNRWPVYLVYFALVAFFVFGVYHMRTLWEWGHNSKYEELTNKENPVERDSL